MDINDAFGSAYAAVVSKPSKILPFYFMSVSVPAVARAAPLIAGVFVYLALLRRGRIGEIRSALEDASIEDPPSVLPFEGGGFGSEGFERTTDAFTEVFELVFVPEVVAVVGVSALVFVVLLVGLNAAVSAGQVGAVYGVLTGADDPVADGVGSVFENTSTFAFLFVVEAAVVLAATAVFAGVGAFVASLGGFVAAALGVLLGLLWLLTVATVHVFFVFAPQSVVVDDTGLRGALRGNFDFVVENTVEFVAYLIFAFAALVGFGSVAGFLNVLGAPAAVTVVGFVVFSPFVAVVKTDMYVRHAGEEVALSGGDSVDGRRILDSLRGGLDEVRGFVAGRPFLVVVSGVFLIGTAVVTWEATRAAEVGIETSIANRLEGTSPFGEFVNYTANNWAVGVAQSYAGFAFGIATVVSLAFNGFFLGFLAATEANLAELVAFVIPHGVIEIPALLISGALGLHLGGVAVAYARGDTRVEGVADEVRKAYRVLLGLFVLFAVAGFVEGFVSPYYYGPLFGI